ncbi:MAG TPA: MarR family transcriptional regulator [Acidimicrobiales bacterium]|nr:MarR family transcriptional regulator [Acidimicrobiales bacterium]
MVRVDADFETEFPGADARATECYANLVRTGDLLIGLHNQQAWTDYRLSGSAKQALAVLDGAGEMLEPSVIAERLLITSGSMTSLIDTLEKAGYVERRPHPDDRRKVLVEITAAGAALVDEMLPTLHARERTIMSDALTPAEQATLLGLLAKVQVAARAHSDDPPDRAAKRRRPKRLASPD